MIEKLKSLNKTLLLFIAAIAATLSQLLTVLTASATVAYTLGLSYTSVLAAVIIGFVLAMCLVQKLVMYIAFRLFGSIYSRRCRGVYAFPVTYTEFQKVYLSFGIIRYLITAVLMVPVYFILPLNNLMSAISQLVIWAFYFLFTRYLCVHYAERHNRADLCFALMVVMIVLAVLNAGVVLLGAAL